MPGIGFGDWGEMQIVPHVLGIAHPTGYPTYVLLAAAFQQIPIGSVAFRGNVLSAVLTSLAVGVAILVMLRLGVRPAIAGAAGLALGLTGTVWAAATSAEVNPLHLLFAVLLLHRALVWQERRTIRDLAIGGLLIGLALGNHLLTLTIAPFVIAFVLWSGRAEIWRRPWILASATAATLLGLAVYLYLPIRASQDPPLAYNHPESLGGVLDLVGGTQFREKFGFLTEEGPGRLAQELGPLWDMLSGAATPVIPALGVVGLLVLIVRRPAFGVVLIGILLGALYFYATYERLEHYLLVPLLALVIGSAVALQGLADRVAGGLGQAGARTTGVVAAAAALALVVTLGALNWPASDRSGDHRGEIYIEEMFGALPQDAALLSYWHVTTPIWYAQLIDDRRPDVLVVDDSNVVYDGWGTREQAIAELVCRRPVFIIRPGEFDLVPTRAEFTLRPIATMSVAAGGPSATVPRPLYEVLPIDGSCPRD